MSQTLPTPPAVNSDSPGTGVGFRIAARTALVAAVFSLVVCALLLYDYSLRRMKDPFEAPAYLALKAALKQQPENAELQEQIRALDEGLRAEYDRQRRFAALGAVLLCGGCVVFLIAAKTSATLRRKLPMPAARSGSHDAESQWTPAARAAVGVLAVGLAAGALALQHSLRIPLPEDLEQGEKELASADPEAEAGGSDAPVEKAAPTAYVPSAEEVRAAWSRFRGSDGSGISSYTNVPETWDGPSGASILWKTPVPLAGNNSPVVCGRRVFLSGADEKGEHRQVYGFDAADGKLLWQQDVPLTAQGKPAPDQELKVQGDTGFASATTAADEARVFAIFANGDVAAFDFDGEPVWVRGLGIPDNSYGHAASLLVYKDRLLVPFDQGTGKPGKSKLYALDAATGKTVWEQARPVPNSWTTPIVIQHAGRDQIITVANPWIIAHDAKDGKEIWRAKAFSGDVAPSPVYAGGIVFAAANDHSPLCAVRPDGTGDVTSQILWKGEEYTPDTCSPLATEQFVIVLTSSGLLTGYDPKTGDVLWEEDLGGLQFKSSPSMAGNRLYLIAEEGKALIMEPSKQGCKKTGEANLGEKCVTSPAFQDGRIYLRGEKHLFCIGKK